MSAPFRAVDGGVNRLGDVAVDGITCTRECRYGRMKWLATDYGVGQMFALYGEYFEGEVALLRKLLRPGDTVITAGGNIGAHVVPLAKIVGESGRVITFEPQDYLRGILWENVRANGCWNVEVFAEALGEKRGEASLPRIDYTMPNNFGGMELRDAGPCMVPVLPIDAFKLEACHMIMLDVEGYEEPALRGAVETIMRFRPLLYVEIDREATRESVLAYMAKELKYELLYHTPTAFNPDNFAGNPDNPFGTMCGCMCLGIPR